MRVLARFLAIASAVLLSWGMMPLSLLPWAAPNITCAATANVAVGPQYDSTHVYVAPDDFNRFVASFLATFGGSAGKQVVVAVTPTPSSTISQLVTTPVGMLSVFGFKTPIPFLIPSEWNGRAIW